MSRSAKPFALTVPVLGTARLRLEPLSAAHSGGMFALWQEPEVCAFAGDAFDLEGRAIVLPARAPADSNRILAFFVHGAAEGTRFRWAAIAVQDDSFIGAVGFNSLGAYCEYAYHFIPRFWHQGFALEASRAALTWLSAQEGHRTVECFIEPANVASVRLATHLGLKATGEFVRRAERFVGFQPQP